MASCRSQNSSQKPVQPCGIESRRSRPFLTSSPTPVSGPFHLLTPLPGTLAPSPHSGPCSRALPSPILCLKKKKKKGDSVTFSTPLNHFEIRWHVACITVCFPHQNVSFLQASVLFAVIRALKQGLAQSCRIQ